MNTNLFDKFKKKKEAPETQKSIIDAFKDELADYKKQIQGNTLDKTQKESLEFSFARGLNTLRNNVGHLSMEEQTKFQYAIDNLTNQNKEITEADFETIEKVLDSFATHAIMLDKSDTQNDLLALKESINEIKETKTHLSQLESTISGATGELPQVQQLVEKAKRYTEELKGFKEKHPYWTKALMMLIPKEVLATFFKTEQGEDDFSKIKKVANKLNIGGIENVLGQFKGMITTFLIALFDMPWIGAPKEMQQFLANIKKDFGGLSEGQLAQVKTALGGGAASIGTIAGESREVVEEELDEFKNKFASGLPTFVKKYFGKDLSSDKLQKVMSKMDLKGIYERTVDNPNLFDGIIEGLMLPGIAFFELVSALKSEQIINNTDIFESVYLMTKDTVVEYGTKSLGLLVGVKNMVLGEISIDELKQYLGRLYGKDPELSKGVLYVLVYRTGGGMLKFLGSIGEFATNIITWTVLDNRTMKETFDVARESLRGDISSHIKNMEDILDGLPTGLSGQIKKELEPLKLTLEKFNENAKIVKAYNQVRITNVSGNFSELVKKEYKKMFPSDDVNKVFSKLTGESKSGFRSQLTDILGGTGRGLNKNISNFSAALGEALLGNNSEKYVLNNMAKRIEGLNDFLVNVVKEDELFSKIRSNVSKLFLFNEGMKLKFAGDRILYKFDSVNTAKKWVRNLKTLAQSAPETVKKLIAHSPVITIVGIDLSADKPLSENLKELAIDLSYAVPFVGSIALLRDGAWKKDLDYQQMGVGGALFIFDTYFAVTALKKGKFLEYMARPITDVADLLGIANKGLVNLYKMSGDALKLIKNGKFSITEFSKLIDGKFPKLSLKFGKKGKFGLLLLAMFGTYELVFAGDSEVQKEIEKYKKECGDDMNCIDEKIKQEWSSLDDGTKQEFIALSIKIHYNQDVQVKNVNGKYKITLISANQTIPNYTVFKDIESRMKRIISKYEGNKDTFLVFSNALINKEMGTLTFEKKKEYLSARGYPHPEEILQGYA